jgi:hypothetical protein
MNEFSIDILLEFLYTKFATTIMFCFFGAFVREYLTSRSTDSNGKKCSKFNFGKVLISSIFSTFLLCAAADYVNKAFSIEVYLILAIVLGMWGMSIIRALMDGKFLYSLFTNLGKSITNPILKGVADSVSKSLETSANKQGEAKEEKKEEKQETKEEDNKENK